MKFIEVLYRNNPVAYEGYTWARAAYKNALSSIKNPLFNTDYSRGYDESKLIICRCILTDMIKEYRKTRRVKS